MPASDRAKPLVSVLVPTYNEEDNVRRAYDEVVAVFAGLGARYDYEIIFADNDSRDRTFEILREIAQQDRRVRVLRYARNFGFQRSVLTCYRCSRGDAAVQLDCDLQDPPSLIPTFLEHWERGHDVVVGVRQSRREGRLITWLRKLFYRGLNRISEDNLIVDGGDFRLVDRSVIDRLHRVDDADPYVRGLVSVLSRNQVGIPYARNQRLAGESKYRLGNLVRLAVDGIVAHSTLPLRLATYLGGLIALLAIGLSMFYLVRRLLADTMPSGFATLAVINLFSLSLNAILLGTLGLYIGRIYRQVHKRPTTIIAEALNMDDSGPESDETLWQGGRGRPPSTPDRTASGDTGGSGGSASRPAIRAGHDGSGSGGGG